ncbi:hypothetical protein I6B53_00355 [Schaalia sp. 19OD2882]|uniref:variant leucine-rich repeat-containing protein n=1 Tax=Schaalia sp. 19OD2882 TaxID=2794089 RepID=UPI001C1EB3A1|nr:hypothetical protein [Schaalia sp. 19OD2882]QWW19635.1 hypothetical protein I6B53_00355 [Schaalia sp. 19OD2882]
MADFRAFTPEMASDPNLPPELMGQIASQRPDLHWALARNPRLTPSLRAWLQSSPDPAVRNALAAAAPQAGQWGQPQAPQAPQWGQPQAPQAPQWGQPQAPQAPQWGQPQAPQAPQWGQPQPPQAPQAAQWGQPQGQTPQPFHAQGGQPFPAQQWGQQPQAPQGAPAPFQTPQGQGWAAPSPQPGAPAQPGWPQSGAPASAGRPAPAASPFAGGEVAEKETPPTSAIPDEVWPGPSAPPAPTGDEAAKDGADSDMTVLLPADRRSLEATTVRVNSEAVQAEAPEAGAPAEPQKSEDVPAHDGKDLTREAQPTSDVTVLLPSDLARSPEAMAAAATMEEHAVHKAEAEPAAPEAHASTEAAEPPVEQPGAEDKATVVFPVETPSVPDRATPTEVLSSYEDHSSPVAPTVGIPPVAPTAASETTSWSQAAAPQGMGMPPAPPSPAQGIPTGSYQAQGSAPQSSGVPFAGQGGTPGQYGQQQPMVSPSLPIEGAPQRGKGRTAAIIAVIVVIALVLVLGLGYLFIRVFSGSNGAASPEELHEKLTTIISNKDLAALGGQISPAEIAEMDSLTKAVASEPSKASGPLLDQETLKGMADAITISNNKMEWSVAEKNDNLAVLQVDSWSADVTVDPKFVDVMQKRYEESMGRALSSNETEIFDRMRESITEDGTHSGDVLNGNPGPRVIAVNEGGRWYVSGAMTMAESMLMLGGGSPNYAADLSGVGAESPEAAVTAAWEAMNSATTMDEMVTKVGQYLPLTERRLAAVYGSMASGSNPLTSTGAMNADLKLSSTQVDGGAVVSMGDSVITVGEGNRKQTITFTKGSALSVKAGEFTLDLDYGRSLTNPERIGLFTVKQDGKWYVSLSGTISNFASLRATDEAIAATKKWLTDNADEAAQSLDSVGMSAQEMIQIMDQSPVVAAWMTMSHDVSVQVAEFQKSLPTLKVAGQDDLRPTPTPGAGGDSMSTDEIDKALACLLEDDMASCDWLWANSTDQANKDLGKTCGHKDQAAKGGTCVKDHGKKWKGQ